MDLGELIYQLRAIGNNFAAWNGIETNIESAELKYDENNGYSVELKVKKD